MHTGSYVKVDALDTEFVERLKSGSPEAQEQLVRLAASRVFAKARSYLRCDEEAKDCVQETFLKAFEKIDDFRGDSNIVTWLVAISRNCALMRLRKKSREPLPLDTGGDLDFDTYGNLIFPPEAQLPCSEKQLIEKDTAQRVRATIDALPEFHRAILTLRDIEGLSTKETADALSVTENLVKVRLHRARIALRDKLLETFGNPIHE
ncbi:MAG: sigma-70 family RNA polymerase sigma factor [Kordiimonadaceae bacterium]|nr:sigma-70 family RNA polymerase sigma factor [Kordiimonadaceae bacterium]